MLPEGARLVVPVVAATGGSARSTVAFLLANELAAAVDTAAVDTAAVDTAAVDTVVMDQAPRLVSPWPSWTQGPGSAAGAGGGLAALPPDRPLTRADARAAAAARRSTEGDWHVLTDGREWHAAPLKLPPEPAAWYQLAAVGGWQAVIADTAHPVAHDLLAARCDGSPSLTRAWCDLPFSVPVLCAQATAEGVQTLQQAVMVLHAEGLPLQRTVVVLAATADGRPPAVVRAAATMLSARVAAVLHLPHDADIRAYGLQAQPARICPRTRQAARELATAVIAAAHASFGDPLPDAARPVPLPAAAPLPDAGPLRAASLPAVPLPAVAVPAV